MLLAVNEPHKQVRYPSQVRFVIQQDDLSLYRNAADFLNLRNVDLVCLHYDSEVFGGPAGSYVLSFIRMLQSPVVVILSDVPADPDPDERQVLRELPKLASRLVVSTEEQSQRMQAEYDVRGELVDLIPFPASADIHIRRSGWQEAVMAYVDSFHHARQTPAVLRNHAFVPVTSADVPEVFPPLKLDHYLRMTDETGIYRKSILSLPDYKGGYATEDNARALIFSLLLEITGKGPFIHVEMQASRYLAFLWYAFNEKRKTFRTRLSYSRVWQEENELRSLSRGGLVGAGAGVRMGQLPGFG